MTFRNGWWDKATPKKLGKQTEPKIQPLVLNFHTIVGTLLGAYNVFKQQGYYGDESTFGIAGPWDKSNGQADGECWQFQSILRQADADYSLITNSIETSDGGNPNHPWSSAMMDLIVVLGAEWCEENNRRPELVPATGDIGKAGLGYHERRAEWNHDGHVCPGAVREGQLRQIVIPKIRARVNGTKVEPVRPNPHYKNEDLDVDGVFGIQTIAALQRDLIAHGFQCGCPDDKPDAVFGPATRKALKQYLHAEGFLKGKVDSNIDDDTVIAWKKYLKSVGASDDGLVINGVWGHALTRALQRALKRGDF